MPVLQANEVIRQALRLTAATSSSIAIASHLNCSPSLVSAWRSGQRIPSSEQADRLAKYLFPKDSEKQRWLKQSINDIRDPKRATLLSEIAESDRIVRVGSTSLASFGRIGFLDQFMQRFFQVSGIKYHFVENELVDLKEQLVQDELEAAVGIFATLDRSLLIKFFPTPIRVGLNAVVLEDSLQRTGIGVKALRELLAPENLVSGPAPTIDVVPLVISTDVGGIYVFKTLGFDESDVDFARNRHYKSYGDGLVEQECHYAKTGVAKTPVAIVDEITALYVLKYLDKLDKLDKDKLDKKDKRARAARRARLVFPISTEGSAALEKKWLPEYLVSISVKRTNVEFVDYLQDVLRLFLRTEVQMISSFYKDVCAQFEDLATEVGIGDRSWHTDDHSKLIPANPEMTNRACARAWVEYAFGLTTAQLAVHQDFELPWKPILQKTRNMIDGNQGYA